MVLGLNDVWERVVTKRFDLVRRGVPVALLCGCLAPAAVGADLSSEVERLHQQVSDLQARVQQLEERMDQGVPVNRALEVQPVEGGWRQAFNWSLLDGGMQTSRVSEILGEPDRRRSVSKFEFWHYGDEGLLRFYLGRLKSWEIPSGIAAP